MIYRSDKAVLDYVVLSIQKLHVSDRVCVVRFRVRYRCIQYAVRYLRLYVYRTYYSTPIPFPLSYTN